MNTRAWERLQFEYENWHLTNLPNITANPIRNTDESYNFFEWECVINDEKSKAFATDHFQITLSFNKNYPLNPPKCKFKLPIFHPNVTVTGEICTNLLGNKKSRIPALTVEDILFDIHHIIFNPEVHNIANIDPGYLYLSNRDAYWEVVKKYGFVSTKMHQEYLQTLIKQECDDISRCSKSEKKGEVDNNNDDEKIYEEENNHGYEERYEAENNQGYEERYEAENNQGYEEKYEIENEYAIEINYEVDKVVETEKKNMNKNEIEEKNNYTQNMENRDFVSVFSDNDNAEIFYEKVECMLNDLESFIDNKLDAYLTDFRLYVREINERKDEKCMHFCNDDENPNINLTKNNEINKQQFQSLKPSEDLILFDTYSTQLSEIEDMLQNFHLKENSSTSCIDEKGSDTFTDSTNSSNITEFCVALPRYEEIPFQTQEIVDKCENLCDRENSDRIKIEDQHEDKCVEINVTKASQDMPVIYQNELVLHVSQDGINTDQLLIDKENIEHLGENETEVSNVDLDFSPNKVNINSIQNGNTENKVCSEKKKKDIENEVIKVINVNVDGAKDEENATNYEDNEDEDDEDEDGFQYSCSVDKKKDLQEWVWKI